MDTYHDRQNRFIFRTNPAGTEYDAQVTNERQENFSSGRQHRGAVGGFFGGDRINVSSTLRWRIGEGFNTELRWSRNDIDLSNSSFVTNLVHARLSYSFTPRIFVQGLLQYNDVDNLWSTNGRFGWLQGVNTGLIIVYNELREVDEVLPTEINRSVIMKYSQLFDLLNWFLK